MMHHVTIYTDGSCLNTSGEGGWAAILIHPQKTLELYGSAQNTTSNRMELMAAIEGLRALKTRCRVDIYTDSQYVQLGITKWIDKWIRKRWRKVKNVDLWKELHELATYHETTWFWVRGHAGHEQNERAHELANKARLMGVQ